MARRPPIEKKRERDSQWPRYYVFEKPLEDGEFIHAGSVHASDPEMAILNARDVFARRPQRVALWVVRAEDIYSKTKEEIDRLDLSDVARLVGHEQPTGRLHHVFQKKSQKGVMTWVGSVSGSGSEHAFQLAYQEHPNPDAAVWWIIPDAALSRTEGDMEAELLRSSPGKPFRHESHYPVRTMMRAIKQKRDQNEPSSPRDPNDP